MQDPRAVTPKLDQVAEEAQSTDSPEPAEGDDLATRIGTRVGQAIVVVLVLALPVLIGLVAYRLWAEGEIDPKLNPINAVFASRIVLGMVRIGVVVAVIFVIVSLVMASVRGQFLLQVGPIRLSDSVRGVAADRDRLRSDLDQAGRTIGNLERKLQETVKVLESTGEDLDVALSYIASIDPPDDR